VVAVLLIVAMLGVFVSGAVGGYGIAQRVFLVLSSIWVLVTLATASQWNSTTSPSRSASSRPPAS
jgi:hypothetical protein